MKLMPDISHWNDEPPRERFTVEDFQRASNAQGEGWVSSAIMIKATESTDFVDPQFRENARLASQVGWEWGAYHFVRPGFGRAQANHFFETAMSVPKLTFLCIDWEAGGRETALAIVDRLNELKGAVEVGDYIGSHARANGGQLPRMDFHMVPQYGPARLNPDYATDPLSAWQYTNGDFNGTDWPSAIPGLGKCDVSALYRPEDFGLGTILMAVSDLNLTQKIGTNTNGTDRILRGALNKLWDLESQIQELASAEATRDAAERTRDTAEVQRDQADVERDQERSVQYAQMLVQMTQAFALAAEQAGQDREEIVAKIQETKEAIGPEVQEAVAGTDLQINIGQLLDELGGRIANG